MNQITFPGLGLNFIISKIAFTLFGVNVYWYALLITFAIALGFILVKLKNDTFKIKSNDVFDGMIYTIPISIICARIYYVIFNFDVFKNDLLSIFNFRTGGMAIYGAIIGGLVTLIIFSKKRKINILDLLDYIVPMIALGQAIGRWGNFFNIEAYGTQTKLPWRMGIYEETVGAGFHARHYIEVHPTFLYESIITLFLFIFLTFLTKKRKYSGQITYIYLFVYGFARFFIENLRTDSLMFYNIRISAIVSMAICVIICSILIKNNIIYKKTEQNKQN